MGTASPQGVELFKGIKEKIEWIELLSATRTDDRKPREVPRFTEFAEVR